MNINYDGAAKSAIILFTDNEWDTLAQVRNINAGEMRDLLNNWLKEKSIRFDTDNRKLVIDKIATATPGQLDKILKLFNP